MIQENTKLIKVFKFFSIIFLLLLIVSCSSQVSQSSSEPEDIHYDKQFVVRNYTFKEKISGYAKDLIDSYDEITERVDLSKSSAALEELHNLINAIEHGFEVDQDYWLHVGSHFNPTFVYQVAAKDCVSTYSFQFYDSDTVNSCTKFQTDPFHDGLGQDPYDPSKSTILGEMIRIKKEIEHGVWACQSPDTADWQHGECINYCTGWAATIYYKVYRNIFSDLFSVGSEEYLKYVRVPASNGYSMASAFGEPSSPHSKYFTTHEIKTVDDFKQYAISGSIFSRTNMGHVIFIEGVDTANDIVFQSEGAVVRSLDGYHGVFVHSGWPIQTWLEYQGCHFAGCYIAVPNPEIKPYARSVLECDFFSTGHCQTYRDEEAELYDPRANGVTQGLFSWEYAGIIH